MQFFSRKIINKKKSTGIALVAVLLIVALVSIIATSMTQSNVIEIRRSTNSYDYLQAKHYVLSAEQLAINQFESGSRKIDRDDLEQFWSSDSLYFPVDRGHISGEIIDANRCFNLNSLVIENNNKQYRSNTSNYDYYRRLLSTLDLPESLADSLTDWLDSNNQELSIEGAEDNYYELLSKPYKSANSLITDISELRLIKGYTSDIFNKLSPYVCALPQSNYLKLNINTLDKAELFVMLIPDLTLSQAQKVIDNREVKGYKDLNEFWNLPQLKEININNSEKSILQSLLGLNSDYFILTAKAEIGQRQAFITSLFKQQDSKQVEIIWRHFKRHINKPNVKNSDIQ